jgi:hypothetical protein
MASVPKWIPRYPNLDRRGPRRRPSDSSSIVSVGYFARCRKLLFKLTHYHSFWYPPLENGFLVVYASIHHGCILLALGPKDDSVY